MWNDLNTGKYEGMIAETVKIQGHDGKWINTYFSRPLGDGNFPGMVLIPHMPGWDEWCRETARRFTQHGYMVMCPDIYADFGTGTPPEVSGMAREQGGTSDKDVMADAKGAMEALKAQPTANGKVGVIGMCSGGRHAYLAACTVEGFDAAVDCWGGAVQPAERLSEKQPVAPIDCTENMSCPIIGIFGNEDFFPTPADVDKMEEALKKYGKEYEFYRYDGAGHGIWYYDKPMYRQEQAMDSFNKVLDFLDRKLK